MNQTLENCRQNDIEIDEVLADAGYSSGESLKYCKEKGINAYIPNFGQYKPQREGFYYNKSQNRYECQKTGGNHAALLFKGTKTDSKGYAKNIYRSSEKDCAKFPLRAECCGKVTKFKKLDSLSRIRREQHPQTSVRRDARKTKARSQLHPSPHQTPKFACRASFGNAE